MHNNIKQANFSFAADFFPARALAETDHYERYGTPQFCSHTLHILFPSSHSRHVVTHADGDKVAIMVFIPATI